MICIDCRKAADFNRQELHESCLGESQCVCQHREIINGTGSSEAGNGEGTQSTED